MMRIGLVIVLLMSSLSLAISAAIDYEQLTTTQKTMIDHLLSGDRGGSTAVIRSRTA